MSNEFPSASIGLSPGDVVSVEGCEHWLEGAWLLSELAVPVAAIFFASDATLAAAAAPRNDLFRLRARDVIVAADAPFVLEDEGTHFERERRLPVALTSFGDAPELPAREALFLQYRSLGGDALLVLSSPSGSLVWNGSRADPRGVERWGTRV